MKLVYKVQGQHLTKTGMPPLELAIDKAAMEADLGRLADLDACGAFYYDDAEKSFLAKYSLTSVEICHVSEYEQKQPKAQDRPRST